MAKVFLGCLNVRLVQFLKKFSLKLFKNCKKRSYSFLQRCSTEGCHIIFSKNVRLLNHQQHSFLPTFLKSKLLEDSERKPGCRRHVDDAAKSSQRGWLARRVGIIDFYGLSATIFKRFSWRLALVLVQGSRSTGLGPNWRVYFSQHNQRTNGEVEHWVSVDPVHLWCRSAIRRRVSLLIGTWFFLFCCDEVCVCVWVVGLDWVFKAIKQILSWNWG